ncbi:conjugative transfer signal peptidase TraF [Sphingomonas kyeonggiensis]|uniref:Conjugative transfer signal peptidase TraF n=1 Tax=Sphingomonas kyeonggiensis TaxID=1268553 RepID=A0A7W7K6J1_9SPHN|nr:S26 family signal peptidase [Sphingomonas kyeonggiensis]MBB4841315.1 conjugative transfer signal peptidase TraF [Sphingomonas kyeonggiensis]
MRSPGDLPLFRWEDARRRKRQARNRRLRLLAFGLAGAAAIMVPPMFSPVPRLVWNVSASAPMGLYAVSPGAPLARDDMVAARTPLAVRALAAERRYVPANVPLVKRVAAVPGDRVCAIGAVISVNGQEAARRLARDPSGRPMPWWRGCRPLGVDEYLLLMPAAASFDGRYFGPVHAGDILGKAVPLWGR